MPFTYEFYIDSEKVNVEIGFSTARKWEEALDEAKLVIPFSYLNDTPYKMFSMVDVTITEIDNYIARIPVGTKTYEFIIYSDMPEAVGSYGYYRHTVSAIEYTAKLDYYFVRSLAKSRAVIDNTQAPFISHTNVAISETQWFARATLKHIDISATIRGNTEFVFDKVDQAYLATSALPDGYKRADAILATNATLISGTNYHVLSTAPATWVFPKGKWQVYYGFTADGTEGYGWNVGFNPSYTFYVDVIDEQELSMYDVIDEIRTCISKFGGLEDTRYFNTTRVFDIDSRYDTLLKSVQAPQIYMSNATARQMIIYALSFVNSLPRLERGEVLDNLALEQYNLNTGSFEIKDVVGFASQQNTNQIGTRNYQVISQGLSNDLDDPSVMTPSRSGYQQVRSLDIQLTENNFTIKLPERSPMYMPKKLIVVIPSFIVYAQGGIAPIMTRTNFELDLTARWINGEEWKLKDITENFPTIESRWIWDYHLGRRLNKVENLSWNVGDTEIKLADIFGTYFQDNLSRNVIKLAIYEYVMLNMPTPILIDDTFDGNHEIVIDMPLSSTTTVNHNREWKFRVEYITDERLAIKQDKEDLSQVSFYSEMRQNQEESLVNIVRQSKKGYGDLQRTGNVTFKFPKKHTSLSQFYEIGMKDIDDYTISQIDTTWFNDFALATYTVIKYHNRIQQATFVNQKYRPFDNFAKTVLDRHEYYGDYLIALPPDDIVSGVQEQSTKIYDKTHTIRTIVSILLGNDSNGKFHNKATVALIRTDGMLDDNVETDNNRKFIVTPVSARGIKGGFAFTFGFQNNQIAGDGLVSKTKSGVTTYYNQAKRYTDSRGRFTRFGFAIMKDMRFEDDDYVDYPLIENDLYLIGDYATSFDSYFKNNVYFWCGNYNINEPFEHPLVWNKDPMTNANLTYGLNVLSFYMGLYIFGIKFFTDNYIVKEHEEILNGGKLYKYTNGTTYELFDDLFVKSGYVSETPLRDDYDLGDGNIKYDSATNTVSFIDISMIGVTSWAIGIPNDDGTISLIVACNEALNGIKFVNRHIRPNVIEIGDRTLIEEWTSIDLSMAFSADIIYERGREVPLTSDFAMGFRENILYYVGESIPITMDFIMETSFDLTHYRSKDIGFTLDFPLEFSSVIAFDIDKVIPLNMGLDLTVDMNFYKNINQSIASPLSMTTLMIFIKNIDLTFAMPLTTSFDLSYVRGREVVLTNDFGVNLGIDMAYGRSLEVFTTLNVPMSLTTALIYTAYHPKYADPTIEVSTYSDGTDGGGHWYEAIYRVKNNDADTGRVGHNVTTATPTFVTANMVILATNTWSSNIEFHAYYTSTPRIVAQARDISGEDDKAPSNVVFWNGW